MATGGGRGTLLMGGWRETLLLHGIVGGDGAKQLPSGGIGGGRSGTSSFSYQLLSGGGTSRGLALPMSVFCGTVDEDECRRTVDVPGVHVGAVV